ncbi:MAG: hypothetical protein KC621_20855 [Myxococcales bacterium]|nr:hypothetical protein [Myxococcales bacterium]
MSVALLFLGCSGPTIDDRRPWTPPAVSGVLLPVDEPPVDLVWEGDAVLGSDADVASFRRWTRITGDLVVEGTALTEVSLPSLQEVGGEVRLWENPALATLDLGALRSVGGDLSLYDDPELDALVGLGSLEEVGGSLVINRMPALVDLDGLQALERVGARLYLFHLEGLRTLDGLEGLREVAGPVQLWEDHALVDATFPALTTIGAALDLFDARSLVTLSLPELTDAQALELHHCDAMRDAGDFPRLTSLTGRLTVQWNPVMRSLDGLGALTSVGSLHLEALPALASTAALSSLSEVTGDLTVLDADALVTLELPALVRAGLVDARYDDGLLDPGLEALVLAAGLRFEHDPALSACAVEALFDRVAAPLVSCVDVDDDGCAAVCVP